MSKQPIEIANMVIEYPRKNISTTKIRLADTYITISPNAINCTTLRKS